MYREAIMAGARTTWLLCALWGLVYLLTGLPGFLIGGLVVAIPWTLAGLFWPVDEDEYFRRRGL